MDFRIGQMCPHPLLDLLDPITGNIGHDQKRSVLDRIRDLRKEIRGEPASGADGLVGRF